MARLRLTIPLWILLLVVVGLVAGIGIILRYQKTCTTCEMFENEEACPTRAEEQIDGSIDVYTGDSLVETYPSLQDYAAAWQRDRTTKQSPCPALYIKPTKTVTNKPSSDDTLTSTSFNPYDGQNDRGSSSIHDAYDATTTGNMQQAMRYESNWQDYPMSTQIFQDGVTQKVNDDMNRRVANAMSAEEQENAMNSLPPRKRVTFDSLPKDRELTIDEVTDYMNGRDPQDPLEYTMEKIGPNKFSVKSVIMRKDYNPSWVDTPATPSQSSGIIPGLPPFGDAMPLPDTQDRVVSTPSGSMPNMTETKHCGDSVYRTTDCARSSLDSQYSTLDAFY